MSSSSLLVYGGGGVYRVISVLVMMEKKNGNCYSILGSYRDNVFFLIQGWGHPLLVLV